MANWVYKFIHQIWNLPSVFQQIHQTRIYFSSYHLCSFREPVLTAASAFYCLLTEIEPKMVFCYCCPPAKRFDTMHSEMLFFSPHFYIVIIKLTTNCSYSNRLNLYGHCLLTSHINSVFLFTELSITRCFFDPFWINSRVCV